MRVPCPRARIEWMAFQFGEVPRKGSIQPVGSLLSSCLERPAWCNAADTIRNGPSETMTKLRVRTGHGLADNED